MSVNEKTVRGCICSSGNVRVYVWIRYRSLVMEYGETCISSRMDDLHKSLTVALREALVWRKSRLPESRLWLWLEFFTYYILRTKKFRGLFPLVLYLPLVSCNIGNMQYNFLSWYIWPYRNMLYDLYDWLIDDRNQFQ